MASKVSVSVPIWFTLIRIELAASNSIPFFRYSTLVTKRSSPTNWHLSPMVLFNNTQPSQSPSSQPSSMLSRSEEHTSELQSRPHLVCRLLLEKKKTYKKDRNQFNNY